MIGRRRQRSVETLQHRALFIFGAVFGIDDKLVVADTAVASLSCADSKPFSCPKATQFFGQAAFADNRNDYFLS